MDKFTIFFRTNKHILMMIFWIIIFIFGLLIILKSDELLIYSTKSLTLVGLIVSIFSGIGILVEIYIKR